ncbi:surface protease GP63 [Trypanosoma conorhini]|uniref:Leishmanolysin-like peptidase n=1 Tax=Trypanosoma conorhini TaxID=83891 RepID=A0A3R7L756_9TRYP|nr:surface protease GP63 [Trypanosoma conorhini]RNF22369.1 surface protease GP63 [Trypanosoma conorhini]
MHVDRLQVKPLTGTLVVPKFGAGNICGAFAIPRSHHTTGVSGADMLLYAAAAPTEGHAIAWALGCAELHTGRPVVGVINFGPESANDSESSVRVAVHEIAHTLGFHINVMQRHKMVSHASGLRGKKTACSLCPHRRYWKRLVRTSTA